MHFQRWVDTHFSDLTLHSLGQVIQLGHDGDSCPQPSPIIRDFTVVDISGVHTVNVTFCRCAGSPHERIQILRASWQPASWDRPQTAFMFNVLNSFQRLNLQGKTSGFDFYESLECKVNGDGLRNIQVCERIAMICLLISLRHLESL